jgi:hypothetical protein
MTIYTPHVTAKRRNHNVQIRPSEKKPVPLSVITDDFIDVAFGDNQSLFAEPPVKIPVFFDSARSEQGVFPVV